MWRSTCAASVSPRDSSNTAALSTLVSLATAARSFICVNPLFHDLGHTARVFCHQTLDCVQLSVIAFARAWQQDALRAAEADAVVGQFAVKAAHATQLDITATEGCHLFLAIAGDVVEHRTQHAEHQHYDEQHAQHLL